MLTLVNIILKSNPFCNGCTLKKGIKFHNAEKVESIMISQMLGECIVFIDSAVLRELISAQIEERLVLISEGNNVVSSNRG